MATEEGNPLKKGGGKKKSSLNIGKEMEGQEEKIINVKDLKKKVDEFLTKVKQTKTLLDHSHKTRGKTPGTLGEKLREMTQIKSKLGAAMESLKGLGRDNSLTKKYEEAEATFQEIINGEGKSQWLEPKFNSTSANPPPEPQEEGGEGGRDLINQAAGATQGENTETLRQWDDKRTEINTQKGDKDGRKQENQTVNKDDTNRRVKTTPVREDQASRD